MLNLAALHESIAARVPDRECLVFRDRRYTWSEITDRTRRFATLLRAHGLGRHRERADLAGHESGQDHVALYLHNGNEYPEAMLGAMKACAAPFNVNYRYVDEELVYLFDNADSKAIVYHATFAPTLARIRPHLPGVSLWLQVDDGSGEPLLAGAQPYEEALAAADPEPPAGLSPDDLYILYTGGTTGMPKGVLWRQEDVFLAALSNGRLRDRDEIALRAAKRDPIRVLPAPPFMHGAAHWAAFTIWCLGGTVVVQSKPERLDPRDIWTTAEKERVNLLTIVGDAFARPLLDELEKGSYALDSLQRITTGGAILTAALKAELLERLPNVRILDTLGSSESGAQAERVSSKESGASTGDFDLAPDNTVLREDLSGPLAPGAPESGWLARRGRVPLGYYKDAEKTARTFPVVDGERYAVPGDRARLEADGTLTLLGRDSVTINTGGEKVFAEEVEHALKHHPGVYDAVVVGTPHPRFGQQVTAIVRLREGRGDAPPDADALRATAREHVAGYKVPRAFVFVEEIVRSPSGKADYRWAKATALAELEA